MWKRGLALTLLMGLALSRVGAAEDAVATRPAAGTAEWPCWRGPTHDGISTEKGWLTAWPKEGLKQLWKVELGPGHSSVAVVAGKVFTMGRDMKAKQDIVFCLNADTGEAVWKHSYPALASDYGGGPRATPAVEGKAVYAVSADGQALCLDAGSGQPIWSKNLQTELDLPMPRHNFSTSPVLDGDLLLLNMGVAGLALEKKTGNVVWKSGGATSYSSPVPCTLGGKRCVALFAASELAVLDLATGQKMAAFGWKTTDSANCADPVIVGDSIFVTASYGGGGALIGVKGEAAAVVWKKKLACHYASPVLVGDCLYALVESGWMKADLVCISVKDGAVLWTQKDVGSGGLMVADGKLIILSRNGDLILAEASPTAYTELARVKAFPEGAPDAKAKPAPCWNAPVLSAGRIYARNEKGTLVCLDVRAK